MKKPIFFVLLFSFWITALPVQAITLTPGVYQYLRTSPPIAKFAPQNSIPLSAAINAQRIYDAHYMPQNDDTFSAITRLANGSATIVQIDASNRSIALLTAGHIISDWQNTPFQLSDLGCAIYKKNLGSLDFILRGTHLRAEHAWGFRYFPEGVTTTWHPADIGVILLSLTPAEFEKFSALSVRPIAIAKGNNNSLFTTRMAFIGYGVFGIKDTVYSTTMSETPHYGNIVLEQLPNSTINQQGALLLSKPNESYYKQESFRPTPYAVDFSYAPDNSVLGGGGDSGAGLYACHRQHPLAIGLFISYNNRIAPLYTIQRGRGSFEVHTDAQSNVFTNIGIYYEGFIKKILPQAQYVDLSTTPVDESCLQPLLSPTA